MTAGGPLERRLEQHAWGSGEGPEFYGPRHDYREALILRELLPRLAGDRVLNAGCGAGSLTLKLLSKGCEVTSLDTSEGFIDELADRVRESHPDRRAPVVVGDLGAMPFGDAEFDAVTCGEVLEHLDDDRLAVREIARVLRPGGVLVASVPANPWRYDWFDHWVGHRRRYTPEGVAELMSGAGLERVDVISWGFPLTGLYHRLVYERLLRRRVIAARAGTPPTNAPPRWLVRLARAAFDIDTLFLRRRPGYFGLLVVARKPGSPPPR